MAGQSQLADLNETAALPPQPEKVLMMAKQRHEPPGVGVKDPMPSKGGSPMGQGLFPFKAGKPLT